MISDNALLVDSLIAKVAGSIDEYIWASENSDNPAASVLYLNCANQREHALKHLKSAFKRLGGDLAGDPDDAVAGDDRLAMNMAFRNALSSKDEQKIEAEIRREEDEILSGYHSILKLDLDEETTHEIRQSLEIVKQSSIRVPADE